MNEIGGNKILLVDGGTKIFLDFGMSFKTANTYFAEFLNPRKCNGILDFVEFGLLPEINGIYRNDFLKHCGFKESPVPSVDAVLLTHAHLDHAAYISHLHHAIPVYCGTATRQILKAQIPAALLSPISRLAIPTGCAPFMTQHVRTTGSW